MLVSAGIHVSVGESTVSLMGTSIFEINTAEFGGTFLEWANVAYSFIHRLFQVIGIQSRSYETTGYSLLSTLSCPLDDGSVGVLLAFVEGERATLFCLSRHKHMTYGFVQRHILRSPSTRTRNVCRSMWSSLSLFLSKQTVESDISR